MSGGSTDSLPGGPALVSHIAGVAPLTDDERRCLRKISMAPAVHFSRGEDLLSPGVPVERAWFLTAGWAMCNEILADGSRHVFDFLLPGELVGLGALVLERELRLRGVRNPPDSASPLTVSALTAVTAVPVEMRVLDTLIRRERNLGGMLIALAMSEGSTRLRRRLVLARRCSARARTADLLLELWERQKAAGMAADREFEVPASQSVLGNMLGIAPAYLCRILGEFSRERIVTMRTNGRRTVTVHNVSRLTGIAKAARASA